MQAPQGYQLAQGSAQGKRASQSVVSQSQDFEGMDPEVVSKLRILEQIKEKAVQ
jgi:hypothetical protein